MLGGRVESVYDALPSRDPLEIDYNYYTESNDPGIPIFDNEDDVLEHWKKNGKCEFRLRERLTRQFERAIREAI
jgi:hypothetical protein